MRKKFVLIFCLAATVIGGLMYWMLSGDESRVLIQPDVGIQDKNTNTIADQWQWNNFANSKTAGESSAIEKSQSAAVVPSDAVGIYRILQSIKLDENGRVLPDQTLKQALEEGFHDLGPNLNAAEIAKLQRVIRQGLPGPAGEEAAHILASYYQFRLSEVEFNRHLEVQLSMTQAGPAGAMESQLSAAERHKELVQLRRSYLGEEIADKLFAVEDNHARHMLASLAIQQNASLTAEDKQVQQEALQEQLNDRLLAVGQIDSAEAAAEKVRRLRDKGASSADIYATREAILGAESARMLAAADREEAQWQSSFNGFWQARHYVMQAGLEESERERQIEQLLDQYFSAEERERARVTSFDWQDRDPK